MLATAATLAAPAWITPARAQTTLRPTPSQTEGPFYPVALPADSDFDLLRNGQVDYRQGEPAWVEGVVTDTRGTPVSGASVEIWQCDHAGRYHHPGDGNRADPAFQGFGQVSVGRDGRYRFRTLKPVPYSSRTPHIHVKVKLDRQTLLTTQMYVAGDPGNERDFLWRRLDERGRAALTVPFTPGSDGLKADFPIVVAA
ncbi:intradiol ring-cleavage dioxygenase [Hydrogenophaga sp.]|uniref:dioxygenase family protein n=1 Tax=Hydrogenophaga sp. TaxID=1904254 RepID=UPI00351E4DAB